MFINIEKKEKEKETYKVTDLRSFEEYLQKKNSIMPDKIPRKKKIVPR